MTPKKKPGAKAPAPALRPVRGSVSFAESAHAAAAFGYKFRRTPLSFPPEIRKEIQAKYLAAGGKTRRSDEFIKGIERVSSNAKLESKIRDQEARRNLIVQISGLLLKLHEKVVDLDSAALAHVVAEIAREVDGNETDSDVGFVLAADVRRMAVEDLPQIQLAVQRAAQNLPVDRTDDPRLRAAVGLNYIFFSHLLAYEVKEKSFAAQCFQYAYWLANEGEVIERPKYWLDLALKRVLPNSQK